MKTRSSARGCGRWKATAWDADGNLVGVREFENRVVNQGLDLLLASTLLGGEQTSTWYVGLIAGNPTATNPPEPAAGDTMDGGHAGWAEVTAYSQANRVTWQGGAVSSQQTSNTGNLAEFTINADGTAIGGACLVGDNTKGGSTGPLYAAGAFEGGGLVLNNGSTLRIEAIFSAEAAEDVDASA